MPPALFLMNKMEFVKGQKIGMKQVFSKDGERYPVTEIFVDKIIFEPGDLVDVTGKSKGLGFTGVVKRHHFKGGPATHGQSDRERAPGSVGSTTTPGRVLKGKRMAGRQGGKRGTVKNLLVMWVEEKSKRILIKGAVPGKPKGSLLIKNTGKKTNFAGELIFGGQSAN